MGLRALLTMRLPASAATFARSGVSPVPNLPACTHRAPGNGADLALPSAGRHVLSSRGAGEGLWSSPRDPCHPSPLPGVGKSRGWVPETICFLLPVLLVVN